MAKITLLVFLWCYGIEFVVSIPLASCSKIIISETCIFSSEVKDTYGPANYTLPEQDMMVLPQTNSARIKNDQIAIPVHYLPANKLHSQNLKFLKTSRC